ncbi:hypothetical protein K435DRAFT_68080 [Dendrothele bispora CBS 962.96]|uniref:Uncharacterized protein n=1 Tax=Dendrothele bispora (strain CBS 962.96) TaxID=1314807 RepID=A0A4S8KQP9_DENBC|nr:hypothetical protein K435DRAFT_68080 [Dendrothele bispora CBS 962.96]
MQSCQCRNNQFSSDNEDVPPLGNILFLSRCSDTKLHNISFSRTSEEYDAVHCIPSNQPMSSHVSEPSREPQTSDQDPENASSQQPESGRTGRDLLLLHGCRNTTLQNVTVRISDISRNTLEIPEHLMGNLDVLRIILEHSRNK